jgi:hypothetical protein
MCQANALEIKLSKIKIISLYFSPKVTYRERIYGVQIMKILVMQLIQRGDISHYVEYKEYDLCKGPSLFLLYSVLEFQKHLTVMLANWHIS